MRINLKYNVFSFYRNSSINRLIFEHLFIQTLKFDDYTLLGFRSFELEFVNIEIKMSTYLHTQSKATYPISSISETYLKT